MQYSEHEMAAINQKMVSLRPRHSVITYANSIKPIVDRSVACVALLLLVPVLLVISVLIVRDSRGPILFKQRRLGQNQREFTIFKFRSMTDGQITRIGKVLRQTGLDELPQLWNIVRGDMSWIGPRPLTEADVLRLGWHQPYYRQRWQVKPGITGLAQLYGGIGRKVTWLCDRRYIQNLHLGMDLQILLASAVICLVGKRFIRRQLYQWRSGNKKRVMI
jgi:lipopolysaccharide/colanic/teichoic acid biosynthesis glycosyltransferase